MTTLSGPWPAPLRLPDHPVRLGFAVGFALLVLLWSEGITPLPFGPSSDPDFFVLGQRLATLSSLVLAAVPLVALRWSLVAAGLGRTWPRCCASSPCATGSRPSSGRTSTGWSRPGRAEPGRGVP